MPQWEEGYKPAIVPVYRTDSVIYVFGTGFAGYSDLHPSASPVLAWARAPIFYLPCAWQDGQSTQGTCKARKGTGAGHGNRHGNQWLVSLKSGASGRAPHQP
jgi:hypothetical protein